MTHITAAMLTEHTACREQVAIFRWVFPRGAPITEAAAHKARKAGLDVEWLADLLSLSAQAAYDAQVAPLWKAHKAQVDSLRKAYDAQVAKLWKAYHAQAAPLWANYDAQAAKLRAGYDAQADSLLIAALHKEPTP